MKSILTLILFSFLLMGCATNTAEKQARDEALNAQGLVSMEMAAEMSPADYHKIHKLIDTSAPQATEKWRNKETKDTYEFTSLSVNINDKGQPCRDYTIKAIVDGDDMQLQKTACRTDNGWQAMTAYSS